ncbi:glycosyltransferase family 4 protein [Carboxydochorda subterranea]|uniref:Glycosyltransferase family 4 protein n=1 Tax=Carboxydichorda subterranea TaxID=3109565 RepID=A0ABZ1C1V0_9FIRM|nr:glycosyltransferase family 4 protein [Limnochorda sp. L945t]WRP18830.1 glycosyltransferase family 4 protein [Limnochorda sp. L945t]
MLYVPALKARYVPDGDAIFATAWRTAEPVYALPRTKGAKFYLIQHYETWDGAADRVDATWRLPMRKVVIARWLYDKGLELGVPASEMRHIPNGLDHDRYRLMVPVDSRPKRVAMLYNPAPWKGAPDGIKALELAKEHHPDLRAVLFGTSPRPTELPSWMEYLRNPPQDDLIRDVYNGSSVYLCPSWTEGWHLPAAEAMACGCAVVSTDNGGIRDYAMDGETAVLAPPREPEALASKLIQVLEDDALRCRLARAGCDAIAGFRWDRSTDLLEAWLVDCERLRRVCGSRIIGQPR